MTLTDERGRPVDLGKKLGAGGEAEIFAVNGAKDLVAKIYFTPTAERAAKLQAMVATPPHDPTISQGHVSICWPKALVFRDGRTCAGFLMHRLDFSTNQPVLKIYNPQDRQEVAAGFTWGYLLRIAANMASVVSSIHEVGYVIGDLNESNFLVSTGALVTLVDCDSMQVPKSGGGFFRCTVGKPDFTAPELQGLDFSHMDRGPAHDNFALGVMIFHLLMEGIHPYAGIWQGRGDPPILEQRIQAGDCPYAGSTNVTPMPVAPPMENLPATVKTLFVRCFGYGHKNPALRPSAREWRQALSSLEQTLGKCRVSNKHVFASHLSTCPWCERKKLLGGWDPYGAPMAPKPKPKPVPVTPAPIKPSPPSTPPVRPSTPFPRPKLSPSPSTPAPSRSREPISIWQLVKSGLLGGLLLTMTSCTVLVLARTPAPLAPYWWTGVAAGVAYQLLTRVSRKTAIIGTGAVLICGMGMYSVAKAPVRRVAAPTILPTPIRPPQNPIPGVDGLTKNFVVDFGFEVSYATKSGKCWLSDGAVLAHPGARRVLYVPMIVQSNGPSPKDCPRNSQVMVAVTLLQRFARVSRQPGAPGAQPAAGLVHPRPVVLKLEAMPVRPLQCQPTILSWETTAANSLTLEPGFGPVQGPKGSTVIRPLRTTQYTLKADGAGGSVTRVLKVPVTNGKLASCPQ